VLASINHETIEQGLLTLRKTYTVYCMIMRVNSESINILTICKFSLLLGCSLTELELLLLKHFRCLGVIFKLGIFLPTNWMGSLGILTFSMLLFDFLKLSFLLLLLFDDIFISIDPVHVIFNEMDRFGGLQTEMSRIQRPKSKVVNANRPRRITFILRDSFMLEGMKVRLIFLGFRFFISSIN
jgi:hypothetical protein